MEPVRSRACMHEKIVIKKKKLKKGNTIKIKQHPVHIFFLFELFCKKFAAKLKIPVHICGWGTGLGLCLFIE